MAATVSAPAQRARPETDGRSEGDRPLPVLPALESLFSTGGLRRGSAVTVRGSASLLLALLAGPSRGGAWCAVVGLPGLGLVAAAEAGIDLERLALVPDPGRDWAAVTAALLDAMEVVVVAPRGRVHDGDVRRLAARARQRGAVLVPFGVASWPGAELRLSLASGTWEGLGDGSGRLRSRRVLVRGEGRGSAARARELALWLPGPDGEITAGPEIVAEPVLRPVPSLAGDPVPAAVGDTPRLRAVPDLPSAPPRDGPPPGALVAAAVPADSGQAPADGPADVPAPPVAEPAISTPSIAALWQDVVHRPTSTPRSVAAPHRTAPGLLTTAGAPRTSPSRARPAGPPVPAGRPAPVGGGPPVSLPPPTEGIGQPPAVDAGQRPTAGGSRRPPTIAGRGRPRIPAEVLARLRPASSLPRPPRPVRAAEG